MNHLNMYNMIIRNDRVIDTRKEVAVIMHEVHILINYLDRLPI